MKRKIHFEANTYTILEFQLRRVGRCARLTEREFTALRDNYGRGHDPIYMVIYC